MNKNNIINWNISKELSPILKIEPYEYKKLIEFLKDYFPNYEYYKNLYKEIKDKKLEEELPQSELNDKIIREYIKCFPGIGIIVLFPKAVEKKDEQKDFIELLNKNGKICYQKEIDVTYQMLYNIIFQQYINTFRMKNNSGIIYKINRLGMYPYLNEIKKIKIIIFHPNKDIKIFGSSVDFKTNLRNIFLEPDLKTTKYETTDDAYPRGHDYLHINDTFNEAVEYADLFFNDNSLSFLKKQACWRFINFINSQRELLNLKKKLYNLSILEQYKFLITSSAILSLYGVRELNDVDIMVADDLKIDQKLLKDLTNNFDLSYKKNKDWTEFWENELNLRMKSFTTYDNYNEFILDPNTSFYFSGLKFMRLKYEIPIRALRKGRPAQIADLLILRRLLNLNYQIDIPKTTRRYNKETTYYEDVPITDLDGYFKTVQFYLKTRHNIDIPDIENIKKWLEMSKIKNKSDDILGGYKLEDLYTKIKDISNNNEIYPDETKLIKMGYNPFLRYLSDNKPYIYEGEDWNNNMRNCIKSVSNKLKKNHNAILRVCSFNVHHFVTRCNQGINPLFGENLNIFETPRNIERFIEMFKEINADVLCLQDISPILNKDVISDIIDNKEINKINFNYLNKKLEEIGYIYKVIYDKNAGNFTKNESKNYIYNANAIYSKKEIVDTYGYQLFINKNICFVDIKFKNKIITIGNTELLSSEDTSNKINKEDNIINVQNDVINNIINNIKNKDLILCGDFGINIYERKSEFINLFNNTLNYKIITNFNKGEQTDFILLSKKSSLKTLSTFIYNTTISDHNAIISNII
jgi:hypothetical protein